MELMLKERTRKQINANLRSKKNVNLVLRGSKGMGKRIFANSLAASALGVNENELLNCNSFILIEPENGIISVETIEQLIERLSYRSISRYVVLIDDADKMSIDVQNKLLKTLEDGSINTSFILICHSTLIETINSRCIAIDFPRFSGKEMCKYYGSDNVAAIMGSAGTPGKYCSIINDDTFSKHLDEILKVFLDATKHEDLRELFSVFHALREKDSAYAGTSYDEWMFEVLFCLIEELFKECILFKSNAECNFDLELDSLANIYSIEEALTILDYTTEYKKLCKIKGRFNKNDFFEYLMKLYTPSIFKESKDE